MSLEHRGMPSAEKWAHGVRARYTAGCRCLECKRANTLYARKLAIGYVRGQSNPLVDAGPMRAWLLELQARGIGSRAVQASCDVSRTVLVDVMAGRKLRVRAKTLKRVLAVDEGARADSAFVPAKETKRALRELMRLGLRKYEIAARLGSTAKQPSLQLLKGRTQVLASTALRVQRLLSEVRGELQLEQEIGSVCPKCGESHAPVLRLARLAPMEGADPRDIRDDLWCWYGHRSGYDLLRRDLKKLAETTQHLGEP